MPASRRKVEVAYGGLLDALREAIERLIQPGRFMFDMKAEYARAEQNRRKEREARGGQSETAAGSSELEKTIDDASQLLPLMTRKSDNPRPMMVGIGETSVHFLDLLMSPGFNHLTASDTGPTLLPRLQTELEPWQAVGVTKLLQSTESMFKGALLCDGDGTGKSHGTDSSSDQAKADATTLWKHFKQDDRPSCTILDKRQKFVCFCDTIHAFDIQVAQKRFPNRKMVRPSLPLHPGVYNSSNRNISVLILDESHDAQDESTLLNAASMILPGSPIQNMEKFDEIFKTIQLTSVDGNGSMPAGVIWNMFSRYFMGRIVSRPRSVPTIPEYIMQVTVPSKPQDRLMYLKIIFLSSKSTTAANHPDLCSYHTIGTGMGEDLTDSFAEFEMDVMEKFNLFLDSCFKPGNAANDGVLMEKCNSSDSLLLGQPLFGPWPEDVWKQLEICQQQRVTDGKAKLGSLTVDELSRFKKYWHSQPCAFNKGHLFLRLGLDHDDGESTSDMDAFYTPELLDSKSAVCSDDLKAAEDSTYQDDGFKSHGDIYDDIHDDMGTKRTNSAWTTGWKKYVYSMEEDESMSPRVRAIALKVAELLHQHQDEKVIVPSTSVLFLDIISQANYQKSSYNSGRSPATFRYDGSVHPNVRTTVTDFLNRPVDVAKKVELLDALSATDDEGERKGFFSTLSMPKAPASSSWMHMLPSLV
ncbi:hypothetical protein NW754_009797 [Fusarium falciforme]|nr:hypothetical protein NW754_009797 [Fusarium falciforme]